MKRLSRLTSLSLVVSLGFLVTSDAYADTIYLSTFEHNTVLKFDSFGNHSPFATANSGLNFPEGLAFDSSGNLYVANSGGGNGGSTIEKFDSGGNGVTFASAGLNFPVGLTFDANGNLFVANAADSIIEKFDSSGHGSVFADATSGLNFPKGLAFDNTGNLYVANYNNTILRFDTNGVGSVFANSDLSNPQGLAFDHSGNLYVANQGNDSIYRFNSNGIGSLFAQTNLVVFPIGLVFASHLGDAKYLAIEVPEPSSFLLTALAALSLWPFRKHKRV